MSDLQVQVEKDDFEKAWVSNYVPKASAADAILQIKDYAYKAFDKLDSDGNGYIEKHELEAHLKDENTPAREKSFITVLLNNQQAISSLLSNLGGLSVESGRQLQVHGYHERSLKPVSYTHFRAHETGLEIVCRLLLEKKKQTSTLVHKGQETHQEEPN